MEAEGAQKPLRMVAVEVGVGQMVAVGEEDQLGWEGVQMAAVEGVLNFYLVESK